MFQFVAGVFSTGCIVFFSWFLFWTINEAKKLFALVSGSSKKQCKPFIIDGDIIGLVPPDVLKELKNYDGVFVVTSDFVTLHKALTTSNERTRKINAVLECLREKNLFCALRGWRYEVSSNLVIILYFTKPKVSNEKILLEVLRAGQHFHLERTENV